MVMVGSHDPVLVALSIVIAIAASYTALDLAGRMRVSAGHSRLLWLATAAIAMGGGIWSMHFVAMLAFSMPGMGVNYDVGLTVLSLLVAIVATGTGFLVSSRVGASPGDLVGGGLLMGTGVVAMHYIGMAAMRMRADLRYDHAWVAISVLIAIGAATAALWLAARTGDGLRRMGAAVLMGIAIAGMHYAGMRAAIFTDDPGVDLALGAAGVGQTTLAVAVATSTFLILFLALVAATSDRRFAALAQREAKALRHSEERFRSLYQGTPLPLHSLDADGRIEQVSNTWLRLLGYARDEVIGRPFINFLTEPSARQARQEDWRTLIETGSIEGREYRAVTKDGRFLDLIAAATVERDGEGRFLHVLGGLTDVTDRRRAEEALREAQKIEAIGQLTGGVAHDFNNLLAVIIGNLDLLGRRIAGEPRTQRLIDSAMEAARRGATLTQRLLAFARRQDLRPEKVDVPALVRGMTDLLQRSLGPRIKVETRFPLWLPDARVDAHQLEMAILNLAVNARDAMANGGSLIISAEGHAELADTARDSGPGRYVRITIEDTGPGMSPEIAARAIDPFYTTKGVGKGTGLGLSMVQGLALQSGGWFELKSEVGHGTRAILYLPAAETDSDDAHSAPARASEPVALSPIAVLVVDDDNLVLANTAAMLDDLGHDVLLAVSGEDALRQMSDGTAFDLLITDQMMPGMTGLELAERARAQRGDLPILMVSGFADLAPSEANALPLLAKPFTQRQLADAMRAVLQPSNVVALRGRR
jgi:PAS domain S-box-containing protein